MHVVVRSNSSYSGERAPGRDADPLSSHCGTLPEGSELNDFVFPLSLQKSRSAEAKYVVEYVRQDKDLLPYAVDSQSNPPNPRSERLLAKNSLEVAERQKAYFKTIDQGTLDPERAAHVSKDAKPDHLQKAINNAIQSLPSTPPRSKTSVVEAAFYLLDQGVLNIPDLNIINVKQARALLWNAVWLQCVMNREWGLAECAGEDFSLADSFQLALMGQGGTGKTAVLRVTEALIKFFCGPDTVRKCAPTNAAARLLGGDTLHAACKLPFGNTTIASKKGRLSVTVLDRLRKEWRAVVAVFIDEASMYTANKFHQGDVRMRQAKKQTNRPFGGLGATISGDFLQLLPVDPDEAGFSLATALNACDELSLDPADTDAKDVDKKNAKLAESVPGLQ